MKKYIIREISACESDFSPYFDDDGFNAKSGDYINTLFILSYDHGMFSGLNQDEFRRIQETLDEISACIDESDSDLETYNDLHNYYPEIVRNPQIYLGLKKACNIEKPIEKAREYLTIVTGKEWDIENVYGYCQGDFCQILYCTAAYENVRAIGELYLGCGKEFYTIELDESGNEIETVYGYYVADSEVKTDSDYKKLVCEMACIDESETELQLIESERMIRKNTR